MIEEDYRGKGLGKWLINCLLEHPEYFICSEEKLVLA
ncbi:hypothetical protein [Gracilibacillus alcaliphilus]